MGRWALVEPQGGQVPRASVVILGRVVILVRQDAGGLTANLV